MINHNFVISIDLYIYNYKFSGIQAKNVLVSFLIGLIFWILLNNTFDPLILAISAGLSLLLLLIFCPRCDVFFDQKLTPVTLLYTRIFLVVFLYELMKSNLDEFRGQEAQSVQDQTTHDLQAGPVHEVLLQLQEYTLKRKSLPALTKKISLQVNKILIKYIYKYKLLSLRSRPMAII